MKDVKMFCTKEMLTGNLDSRVTKFDAWEVAGVLTRPAYRRQGYGEAVTRFCTAKIVERGRKATCTTGGDNTAMINTMKAVGFQPI